MWFWLFFGLVLPHPTIHRETGTLILVGATNTSIVLAADSLVLETEPGKQPTIADKLIKISDSGVCWVSGDSILRSVQNSKTTDKLDLPKVIRDWKNRHPDARVSDAYHSIDAILMESAKAFQHRHPFSFDPIHSFSSFGCAGYNMGAPTIYSSDYLAPTTMEIGKRPFSGRMWPGFFVPLGRDAVCLEITKQNSTESFSIAKSNPAVVRYRKAIAAGDTSRITERDLLMMSRTCLEATESDDGKKFDSEAVGVGPPNHYAVIDEHKGFRWVRVP